MLEDRPAENEGSQRITYVWDYVSKIEKQTGASACARDVWRCYTVQIEQAPWCWFWRQGTAECRPAGPTSPSSVGALRGGAEPLVFGAEPLVLRNEPLIGSPHEGLSQLVLLHFSTFPARHGDDPVSCRDFPWFPTAGSCSGWHILVHRPIAWQVTVGSKCNNRQSQEMSTMNSYFRKTRKVTGEDRLKGFKTATPFQPRKITLHKRKTYETQLRRARLPLQPLQLFSTGTCNGSEKPRERSKKRSDLTSMEGMKGMVGGLRRLRAWKHRYERLAIKVEDVIPYFLKMREVRF